VTPRTITAEFAALADELGVGVYRPDAPGGTIFVGGQPPDLDACITVRRLDQLPPDAHHGYDEPVIEFRVRGPRGDYTAAEETAQAVFDTLHGLRRRDLPGGTRMLSLICPRGLSYNDYDEHGRHEFTVLFEAEVRRVTANRV